VREPSARIDEIQILRALAALAIVIHHGLHEARPSAMELGAGPAAPALSPFAAGVDLFFVISGFVMVHAARDLFGRWEAPLRFLRRRSLRIVPLYWAATMLVLAGAILVPGAVSGPPPELGTTLASFAFIPAPRADGNVEPLYSLGWTLNYEMFFYAVFALFLPLRRKAALAATGLALVGLAAWGSLAAPASPTLAFWSAPIILLFVAGMGIAVLRQGGAALPAWLRGGMAIAACLFLAFDPLGLMRELPGGGQGGGMARLLAWGAPATLLVAAACLGKEGAPRRPRLDALRMRLAQLGDASYALYLVHPFVLKPLHWALSAAGLQPLAGGPAFAALGAVCSSLAALAVHHLAERPVSAWLRARSVEVRARSWNGEAKLKA